MEIDANEYYGFIYITTNNINGKRYIGQKKFDSPKSNHYNKWITYLGSGKVIKQAIEIYGEKNFTRQIISFCKTKEEMDKQEIELIKILKAKESPNYYNIADGGEGYKGIKSRTRPIYCVELNTIYQSAPVASYYTGEKNRSITNKAHFFGKQNIKGGYHYCYIDKLYKFIKPRCNSMSIPVIALDSQKVYGSWENAKRVSGIKYNRRNIITLEQYSKLLEKEKPLIKKLMRLEDYLQLYEYVEHVC